MHLLFQSSVLLLSFSTFLAGCTLIPSRGKSHQTTSRKAISKIYRDNALPKDFTSRIDFFSKLLIGKDYKLGPLGEGSSAQYDNDPLLRIDAFDCTTYVETILALSKSQNFDEFQTTLNSLRYINHISFLERAHFIESDWIENATRKNFLKNISSQFVSISDSFTFEIDKAGWIKKQPHQGSSGRIRKHLSKTAETISKEKVVIEYLPFEKIITQSKDKIVFSSKFKNSLPTQSIFNLILYQNEIDPKIGTKIAVRHQGFLLKKSNQLIIRHADSRDKTVREINANDFFLFHYLRSKLYRNYDHAGLQILKIIE